MISLVKSFIWGPLWIAVCQRQPGMPSWGMVKHKVCPWKRSPDCPEASQGWAWCLLQERATNRQRRARIWSGRSFLKHLLCLVLVKKKRSKFCKLKSILIKSTCSGITLPLGWIHIIHMHVYVLYMYTYVLYVHSTTICTIVESPRRVSYLLLCPRVLICKMRTK